MKIYRCETAEKEIIYLTDVQGNTGRLARGNLAEGFTATDETRAFARILPPVEPSCIIGVGLNYRKHAAELGLPLPEYPVIFAKLPGAVAAHGEAIRIPRQGLPALKADYEAELAVVIGKPCLNASPAQALEHVAGYTAANDVSARDWQLERSGGQWSRGKSFDTFLPLGPCLATPEGIADPQGLAISLRLNGSVMQQSSTADMIFSIAQIISFLSQDTTLPTGAVIITGTPEGVGISRQPQVFLKSGDVIDIEIEGIGVLSNPVS
jgi:2-keto-4-pentenoate hydratase/2-oxohepta-3-ene-1,7-dioic acid hydratase in catechol pathway